MATIEFGGGGVGRGTYDLLLQHVRADAPTPFRTEGTLGHVGLTSADIWPAADVVLPNLDSRTEKVVPEQQKGLRTSRVARAVSGITKKFVSR